MGDHVDCHMHLCIAAVGIRHQFPNVLQREIGGSGAQGESLSANVYCIGSVVNGGFGFFQITGRGKKFNHCVSSLVLTLCCLQVRSLPGSCMPATPPSITA